MRKISSAVMFFLISVTLVGCAKCISTETSAVQVKVTDAYYRPAYTTTMLNPSLKVLMPVTYPAVYQITVEYDGVEYTLSDYATYKKYSDKVGENATGTIETKKYDNGDVKYKITELE